MSCVRGKDDAGPVKAPTSESRVSATLHVPGKVDGSAHGTRLGVIEIGLDLVMCLHARRHAETVRAGLEQRLSLAQGNTDHQRARVMQASDQAVMDVPRWTRRGPLALDLRQRLRIPTNLVRRHDRDRTGPGRPPALEFSTATRGARHPSRRQIETRGVTRGRWRGAWKSAHAGRPEHAPAGRCRGRLHQQCSQPRPAPSPARLLRGLDGRVGVHRGARASWPTATAARRPSDWSVCCAWSPPQSAPLCSRPSPTADAASASWWSCPPCAAS